MAYSGVFDFTREGFDLALTFANETDDFEPAECVAYKFRVRFFRLPDARVLVPDAGDDALGGEACARFVYGTGVCAELFGVRRRAAMVAVRRGVVGHGRVPFACRAHEQVRRVQCLTGCAFAYE